jgi:polyribonucleotide nucleotidyltransferase
LNHRQLCTASILLLHRCLFAVQVPADKGCIGSVIGPRGAQIEEIQRSSACRLQVEPDTGISTRLITIEGTDYAGILKASEMIIATVHDWMRRNGQQVAYPTTGMPGR